VIISVPAETAVTSQTVYYGAMTLEASIVSVSSPTTAILSSPALATINAATFAYGTDNHSSFQTALDSVGSNGGGTVLVPAPTSCPGGAVCGYVVKASDQQTAKAPGAIKIRYSNVSLTGDAPQTNLFCRGAFGTYSNSVAFPGTTGNIRGFCLAIGDDGGPDGMAGTSVSNVTVARLHLYGMTNGNTFNVNFAYPPSSATTDGWDVTHKALYMWDGGSFSNITIDSLILQDFKAENIYSGGSAVTGTVIKNSTVTNFNGNGISMLAADLQVLNNTISNGSNAAVENSTVSSGNAALVRQVYQGNMISNMPREGIVVVGVDGGVAAGKVDIKGNRFDTIGQVNPSGTQSAIYIASQNNKRPPANVTVSGNTCHDCYSFGVFQTGGNSVVTSNTFIVDDYNAGNFVSFAHPASDIKILNNTGYATANAQANSLSVGSVYDINPGYQTGSFVWSNVLLKGNSWTFMGAPQYRFVTSSGLGWGLVGQRNLDWQGDVCKGCTHSDSDHGLIDLSKTLVIEPFGPSVYVNGNTSSQTATVNASLEEDGAQVQIVNAGSNAVLFGSDQNLSLSPGLTLEPGKSVTFTYSATVGKFVIAGEQNSQPANLQANGGTPQSVAVNTIFPTNLSSIVTDYGGNPLEGVNVLYSAQGAGASALFAGSSQANATTAANGIATAPPLTANGQAGNFSVVASTSGLTETATFHLMNLAAKAPAPQSSGLLTASTDSSNAAANLTTEGKADWLHWGDQVQVGKAGVTHELGRLVTIGSSTVLTYSNDPRPISWSDGSPLASAQDNASGVYISGVGQGFSITAPADQTQRALTLHVGGFMSGGTLSAHLSDASAPDYSDSTPLASGQYDGNYVVSYRAGTAAQVLTVTWTMTSGPAQGNVTFNSAALAGSRLSATAGTPQSAEINETFATPLRATLLSNSGAPMAAAGVTFTAVGGNASASFSGSASATVSTRTDGVAQAPALTANSKAGTFQVVATAVGADSPATFTLTNTTLPPANIKILAGNNQQAVTNTSFGGALQMSVTNGSGTGVEGVQVKFSAPASGAGAKFNGASSITVSTGNDGIATSPIPMANSVAGSYSVAASVTGFTTPLVFALTNIPSAGGTPVSGGIQGVVSSVASASLTKDGTTDWVHWGESPLNRKAGVTAVISDVHVVGSGSAVVYTNDLRSLRWTDGSPVAASTNNTDGLYTSSTSDGLSFSVPANITSQKLIVHVGGWLSSGKLVAHLSDGSAPDYIDQTSFVNGQYDRTYTFTFNARSAAQLLQITWMNTAGGGNVTISGAALQP